MGSLLEDILFVETRNIIKDMPYQAKTSRVAIGLGCSHR